MKLRIISERNFFKKKSVSYDTILGLENEFLDAMEDSNCLVCLSNTIKRINKILWKYLGNDAVALKDPYVLRACTQESSSKVFFAAMGIESLVLNRATLAALNQRLIVYIFDCWESLWENYDCILRKINPYAVCFAYEKARKHFETLGYKKCCFMPQSMNSLYYVSAKC